MILGLESGSLSNYLISGFNEKKILMLYIYMGLFRTGIIKKKHL